jgi:hypothetical protein
MPAETSDPRFPPSLAHADPARLVRETFGWQLANWGVVLLFGALWILYVDRTLSAAATASVVAVGVLGAALLFSEGWRRKRPTVLAVEPDAIAVYRRGALDLVLTPGQISLYVVSGPNTIQLAFGFLMFAALFGALTFMASRGSDRLMSALASLACLSALASSVRSRHLCENLLVPRRSGRNESVLIPRRERARILGG